MKHQISGHPFAALPVSCFHGDTVSYIFPKKIKKEFSYLWTTELLNSK